MWIVEFGKTRKLVETSLEDALQEAKTMSENFVRKYNNRWANSGDEEKDDYEKLRMGPATYAKGVRGFTIFRDLDKETVRKAKVREVQR